MGNAGGRLKNKPVKHGSISGEDAYLKSQFKITDEQLKEYRSLFRDHSDDRKVITRKEFRNVYELIYKNGDPTDFADRVFDAFDTDKSGSVDFIEFAAGLTMMESEMVEQKISIAFNMYDADGSKTLSKQEVVDMIQVRLIFQIFLFLKNVIIDHLEWNSIIIIKKRRTWRNAPNVS